MKSLNKILNYKTFPAGFVGLGLILMGFGAYELWRDNNFEKVNIKYNGGSIFVSMGIAYYLGREHEKKLNKNNYQTKSEDYK